MIMKRKLFIVWSFLLCLLCNAQQNNNLNEITKQVLSLRVTGEKGRKEIARRMGESSVKITLMDEILPDHNEYIGRDAYLFWLNPVISYVYCQQNPMSESKGEYYNSMEKGVHYSAIEKSVQMGKTVSYNITGHVGRQEYVILSYSPDSKFSVVTFLNGKQVFQQLGAKGQCSFNLPEIRAYDMMTLQITSIPSKKGKRAFESFAILNYNSQK